MYLTETQINVTGAERKAGESGRGGFERRGENNRGKLLVNPEARQDIRFSIRWGKGKV